MDTLLIERNIELEQQLCEQLVELDRLSKVKIVIMRLIFLFWAGSILYRSGWAVFQAKKHYKKVLDHKNVKLSHF